MRRFVSLSMMAAAWLAIVCAILAFVYMIFMEDSAALIFMTAAAIVGAVLTVISAVFPAEPRRREEPWRVGR